MILLWNNRFWKSSVIDEDGVLFEKEAYESVQFFFSFFLLNWLNKQKVAQIKATWTENISILTFPKVNIVKKLIIIMPKTNKKYAKITVLEVHKSKIFFIPQPWWGAWGSGISSQKMSDQRKNCYFKHCSTLIIWFSKQQKIDTIIFVFS